MGNNIRIPPTGAFIVGTADGQILQWNNTTKKWDVVEAPSGGGGVALSNVLWVDKGTSVPLADQTGAAGAPFETIQQALDAQANPTILICPGDYSAEFLEFGTNRKITLQGVVKPGAGTAYGATSNALIGPMLMTQGGEQGHLQLINLEFNSNILIAGIVVLVDCIGIPLNPGLLGEDPAPADFQIWGGTVIFIDAAGGYIHGATFDPSASIFLASNFLHVTDCNLQAVTLPITFPNEGGSVLYDLASEGTGGTPAFTVTGGTAARFALPVQSITGATEQEQIDSIVTGLVALGFAVDNR